MIKVLFTIIGLQIVVVLTGDISQNVFGQERHYLPAAFGDFNSDGLTDVFVLQGNKQLSVLLASDKEPLLRYSPSFSCTFDEFIIISVVPGDFDGDAFMDIMITTQNVLPSQTKNTIVQQVRIIWGGVDKLNCSIDSLPALATIKGQPLALDYDGNMIIDLFGVNENGERTFWVFGHNRTLPSQILMSEKTRDSVKVPHSHSFLDINGDYTSDLVITSPTMFEVWLGQTAEPNFRFSHGIRMPVGISGHIGQAIFLDVELSGKLYLLVPLCYDKNCINSTILINDGEMWNPLFINFQDENMNTWGFVPPNNELFTDTITMRGGDYNMDGYPDLLVVLKSGKDFSTYQSFLMENIPCENKACNFIRTYKIMWTALNPFKKGVVLSAFYDFYQDGILDFIVLQKNNTNNEYTIGALKNTLEYDANFIKVMVLTGLTNAKTPVDDPFGNKKDTYGTNLPGPRISYHTLSQEGLPRSGVCAQLPQSAYFSLNLPYSVFGLDRTPNFVDSLMVGLSNRSKTWTQLIPNSQIVVIPWPPNDPSQWKVQLFVTPSKVILKSVYVYCGICGILSLLVLFMHYKEKNDDRVELLSNEMENEFIS